MSYLLPVLYYILVFDQYVSFIRVAYHYSYCCSYAYYVSEYHLVCSIITGDPYHPYYHY